MKKCVGCKKEFELDNFYNQQQISPKGVISHYKDSMCKSCRCKETSKRRINLKKKAIEYKGGKCVDCGVVDIPDIYDFHHENPSEKDFNIGNNPFKWERMKVELDKCVLLCANCHRKRHARIMG